MRLFIILLGCILRVSHSAPLDTQVNPLRSLEGGVVITAGIQDALVDDKLPLRREIHDLKDDFPEQWNLYLLGLRSFQTYDQSSPVSYYQIAGIHGRPFKVWQGAEGRPGVNNSYCPHNNQMFLGWHRPYLALFEQELQKHVLAVAQQYPPDLIERYTIAANNFRIPYWDWALGPDGPDFPEFFLSRMIGVIGTNGTKQDIPNPLYRYEFTLISGDFEDKWAGYNHTLRWPDSDFLNAVTQDNLLLEEFRAQRTTLLDDVSKAFATQPTMNGFSQKLETVHGYVHYVIGGGNGSPEGHMWPAQMSAFEPIFMLHHANVDRLWALWQAAHPDKYLKPSQIGSGEKDGNMWLAPNQTVDADTPLLPFFNSPTTFWTTNSVRDTGVFKYAYPETQPWNYESDEDYRTAINETIARLYKSTTQKALSVDADIAGTSISQIVLVDNTFVDWEIRIEASHANLPATFLVSFFLLADFSSDPVTDVGIWAVSTTKVEDSVAAAPEPRTSSVEPGMKGTVGLTAKLLEEIQMGRLESLDVEDVVPYLAERLSWRVLADGGFLPRKDMEAFTIEIFSTKATIPDDPGKLLEYTGVWEAHPEVTMGKIGGVKDYH